MTPAINLLLRRRRSVLSRAAWAGRAGNRLASGRGLVDLTGRGNHAYYGGNSTTPTTNDPTVLQWRGQKEVWFPGTSGNKIDTPDSAGTSVTGDIALIARIAPDTWTPASDQVMIAKYAGTGNQRGYYLMLRTTGALRLGQSTAGTDLTLFNSTATISLGAGSPKWVAGLLDVDNGAGGRTATFYTSDDYNPATRLGTWTPLGSAVTVATAANTFDSSAALTIGAFPDATTNMFAGRMTYAEVLAGDFMGTRVASFNAAALSEPYATHTDPQGNVWTLNRSSSGLKLAVVDRDMLALGTDDFLEVADHPLLNFGAGQSMTLVLLVRRYGTPSAAFTRYFSKRAASGGFYEFNNLTNTDQSYYFSVSDGSAASTGAITNAATVSGVAKLVGGGRRGSSLFVVNNGLFFAGTSGGSWSNTGTARIGTIATGGGNYHDFEFIAAAVFREPLTADDLRRLAAELGVAS